MVTRKRRSLAIATIGLIVGSWFVLPQRLRELIQPTAYAATFTVTTADDHNDGTCDVADCTLREAINAANAGAGSDLITFNISGGGAQTINLTSGLPDINTVVAIDGSTQPGFAGAPLIELNGNAAGSTNGLNFQGLAGGSVVKSLIINRFSQRGINTDGAAITVQGCFIGTNAAGTAAQGNGLGGVRLNGRGNLIGGTTVAARNVISGNTGTGIEIASGDSIVQGNYIGTDLTGSLGVGNTDHGILIESANNSIGGTTAGSGNVISGNNSRGVEVSANGVSDNNFIQGNFVGTSASGNAAIPNGLGGLNILSNNNTIGGTTAGARNVISGNTNRTGLALFQSSGNTVQGNFIGTNSTGTAAVPNRDGIIIFSGTDTIGGTAAGAGNLISGNSETGVVMGGGNGQLQGNLIGTDVNGTAKIPNITGVSVSSANNIIGVTGGRNVISGNTIYGINVNGATASNNVVQNNYIGTDINGTAKLSNNTGVSINSNAPNNTIGGTTASARNVISGNDLPGIQISQSGSTGNQVVGNFIGTNAAGTAALGNGNDGVTLNAPGNTVGGITAGARNIISGNAAAGVTVVLVSGATIQGNFIGTDVNGTTGIGNNNGIKLVNATNVLIGGTVAGAGNVVANSKQDGIVVNVNSSNNQIQGNLIGTDSSGLNGLGNGTSSPGNYAGIDVSGNNNTIGGTTDGARNILAGGLISNNGLLISSGGSNTVQGNYIGTDITGNAALGAFRSGVAISGINNVIGGTSVAARNIISGNGGGAGGFGIDICCGGAATGNQVQGNYIGLKADGSGALGNVSGGIRIASGNKNNTIGGTAAGARNVISGNTGAGISMSETGTTNNLIQGNYIGLNPAGTGALANQRGIFIEHDASGNTIGGTTVAARNVISTNDTANIEIFGSGATANLVQGNYIGTQADGVSPLANPGRGVYIVSSAANNTIGGTAAGAGNVIAFHNDSGIGIDTNAGNGNAILGNSIFSNSNLGIDLSLNGVTANDACDVDSGPNNLQNFPVITSITTGATDTTISGTLNSTASTQFRIEFFASASCDASGNGQGQTFLGSTNVTTDGSCNASFMFVVPNSSITGADITATATDPNNNTSEFSSCAIDTVFLPKTLQFNAANFNVGEGDGHVTITVTRNGDISSAATVDYRTTDTDNFTVNCAAKQGHAFGRCDFATVVGTLTWAAGDGSAKTFDVPIINDSYAEGTETFGLALSNPTGGNLGTPSTASVTINDNETVDGPNPILQTNPAAVSFFVRQHYLDFLGREPEPGEPWSAILNGCANQFNTDPNSPSAGCDRITVSGAFFGSPEFKDKGIYVIDFYRVAFDRLPIYTEFVFDLASVTGTTAAEVNAKRAAFASSFVLRSEFATLAGLSNSNYVTTLMSHSGQYNLTAIRTPDPANPDGPNKVTLTTNDLINGLNASTLTRAQVLRAIVQSDEVTQNLESVNAFVASQYYGYLRRTPDTPGFNSWVNYLKNNPTDFRTMVHGFLDSTEYRLRFGPV